MFIFVITQFLFYNLTIHRQHTLALLLLILDKNINLLLGDCKWECYLEVEFLAENADVVLYQTEQVEFRMDNLQTSLQITNTSFFIC